MQIEVGGYLENGAFLFSCLEEGWVANNQYLLPIKAPKKSGLFCTYVTVNQKCFLAVKLLSWVCICANCAYILGSGESGKAVSSSFSVTGQKWKAFFELMMKFTRYMAKEPHLRDEEQGRGLAPWWLMCYVIWTHSLMWRSKSRWTWVWGWLEESTQICRPMQTA